MQSLTWESLACLENTWGPQGTRKTQWARLCPGKPSPWISPSQLPDRHSEQNGMLAQEKNWAARKSLYNISRPSLHRLWENLSPFIVMRLKSWPRSSLDSSWIWFSAFCLSSLKFTLRCGPWSLALIPHHAVFTSKPLSVRKGKETLRFLEYRWTQITLPRGSKHLQISTKQSKIKQTNKNTYFWNNPLQTNKKPISGTIHCWVPLAPMRCE